MKPRLYSFLLILIMLLFCAVMVLAADVDQKVIDSLHKDQKVSVIVLLKDTAAVKDSSKISWSMPAEMVTTSISQSARILATRRG